MRGSIETNKVLLNEDTYKELSNRYIALDTETTGLDGSNDLITEIGLVLFENGIPTKSYGSLLNIKMPVSEEITQITGITNEMLASAPDEEVVYKEVVEILGDALDEQTIIVAHNAEFDMSFIKHQFERFGIIGAIRYADTLSLSRTLVKGLFNYKQGTIASYFNIINEAEHRALTDAKTCGYILKNLLDIYDKKDQTINLCTPYDDEFETRIRERGIIYYQSKLVNNYCVINNKCSCRIIGAEPYDVELEIIDNKVKGMCNCRYFKDTNNNCKHIYALLLRYHYSNHL